MPRIHILSLMKCLKKEIDIDVIIPWVDGNDIVWQNLKKEFELLEKSDQEQNSEIRYKNWENLHYWFRAVEKNMPWVRYIFFVTFGHLPDFLVVDHPKLKIINHEDYIPKEYLPTFNSRVIELNYHHIEELSENFILFNDDIFPIGYIDREYYLRGGLICDEAVESPLVPVESDTSIGFLKVKMNNIAVINRHFDKRKVIAENREKWFSNAYGELLERNERLSYWNHFVGFHDPHLPVAMKKSTLKKLWDLEPQLMHETCMNRFRSDTGVNQYLIRYWQLCEGDFFPRKYTGRPLSITSDNYVDIAAEIEESRHDIICLSEHFDMKDFEPIKNRINAAFEKLFPNKSLYER